MKYISTLTLLYLSTAVSGLAIRDNHGDGKQPCPAPKAVTVTTTVTALPHTPDPRPEEPVLTNPIRHPKPTNPPPPPSGENGLPPAPAAHTVIVGGLDGVIYDPPAIGANVGDIIYFVFQEKNHTVTESAFDKPCEAKEGGYNIGFVPNLENLVPGVPKEYRVVDKDPHWFYCAQGDHCKKGMVFAVNPTEEKAFPEFYWRAKGMVELAEEDKMMEEMQERYEKKPEGKEEKPTKKENSEHNDNY